VENENVSDSKSVIQSIFLILLLMVVFILAVIIYYLYTQNENRSNNDLAGENRILKERIAKLEGRDPEIVIKEVFKEEGVTQVRELKKPKKELVFTCYSFETGSFEGDERCEELSKALNNKYDLFEVRGVVDEQPYAGPSAELKQEGLASYRAREGAKMVEGKAGSDSIILQGFGVQERAKRGFEVYGYKYE